ncbi:MAG TPA: undecaprenyl-diphosphate phosphatase [Candidatus Limnocylindrales bacterium]|nr:undecaprenyl-diphosphate phosphatase [Candidatus Limnocylindrales bacterium]
MEITFQALVMGIVQGLTEFLPVSSSGHLVIVPALLGWTDPFINSLAFSVMLHLGTLVALLVYFRSDWLAIVPAGIAALRERSFGTDPNRRLAWLLLVSTIPAVIAGPILNDRLEAAVRTADDVAVALVIGAAILWLADRVGRKVDGLEKITFPLAFVFGLAQSIALVPGISRAGITISAGLFAGLTREAAARFSFLMATPIIAGAGIFEARNLLSGDAGVPIQVGPLLVGMVAAVVAGLAAIALMLRYVRTRSYAIFVAERVVIAVIVLVVFLSR